MPELTDHEIGALRKFVRDVEIAGDGDVQKGMNLVREAMIARRNASAFYRFAIVVGGALLAALATGKTVIENVSWLLGLKFGGK